MQFISPGTPTASALHCLQWVNWGMWTRALARSASRSARWGLRCPERPLGNERHEVHDGGSRTGGPTGDFLNLPGVEAGMTTVLIFTVSPASAALATPSC